MRVRVYKNEDGTTDVLVEASLGKGRPPVLLKGVTPENIKTQVLPVVTAMRRPKGAPLDPVG